MKTVRMVCGERLTAAYDAACPITFLSLLFYALRGFLFYTPRVWLVRKKLTDVRSIIPGTDDEKIIITQIRAVAQIMRNFERGLPVVRSLTGRRHEIRAP